MHPAHVRDASAGLIGSNEKMLDRVLMYWEAYVAIYFKRVTKISTTAQQQNESPIKFNLSSAVDVIFGPATRIIFNLLRKCGKKTVCFLF